MTSINSRKYDVVLYGASGFVGRQTVAYFVNHPEVRARGLRFALGGRSGSKLEQVRAQCGAEDADIVVAEAHDLEAMDALARSARVVLSSAGPFALYGSALVEACVHNGTHYVDITGETPWVRGLIDRHHGTAQRKGVRIIPMCGFDSIPSDLSARLATQAMLAHHGEPCVDLKAAFSLRGGVNGGTLASAFNMYASGQGKAMADLFLLNPADERPAPDAADYARHRDVTSAHFDEDLQAWLGPFVMAPVNTRVVRRSAALLAYDPEFTYQEYMRFGRGLKASVQASMLSAGMAATQGAMALGPLRSMLQRMAPAPGEGPSEAKMDGGSFRCQWVATSSSGKQVSGVIADKGDPGNRATTKMLCESALALALQLDDLPGGRKYGGLLTPASGLGDVLIKRLRSAGMTLQVND